MMKQDFKPKGSLVAALDIGSSKVACFIGRVIDSEGGVEALGVGYHGAQGVSNGVISDMKQANNAIRTAVHAAEEMAAQVMRAYPLREVVVGVPGTQVHSEIINAKVEISGHEITKRDMRQAQMDARRQVTLEAHELIHTIPVNVQVDGQAGVHEPIGMHAQSLNVDIHFLSASDSVLRNTASCIQQSHLDVSAYCVTGYAAGLATLVEDEKDLGCTVIDMGAGVTSVSFFSEGRLLFSDAIPVGGGHITKDLARGLVTSIYDAERIKILYGSAVAASADENEMIDVPALEGDAQAEPRKVPRSVIIGIIQPRLEEIFELVRARLDDSGLKKVIGRRVVLTGGASQMPGLRELAHYVLDKQVRLGKPIHLNGLPNDMANPAFSTCAGLLAYGVQHQLEMPGALTKNNENASLWLRVKTWLHENW